MTVSLCSIGCPLTAPFLCSFPLLYMFLSLWMSLRTALTIEVDEVVPEERWMMEVFNVSQMTGIHLLAKLLHSNQRLQHCSHHIQLQYTDILPLIRHTKRSIFSPTDTYSHSVTQRYTWWYTCCLLIDNTCKYIHAATHIVCTISTGCHSQRICKAGHQYLSCSATHIFTWMSYVLPFLLFNWSAHICMVNKLTWWCDCYNHADTVYKVSIECPHVCTGSVELLEVLSRRAAKHGSENCH